MLGVQSNKPLDEDPRDILDPVRRGDVRIRSLTIFSSGLKNARFGRCRFLRFRSAV